MSSMAESEVHLKLLIDTKNKRVLFAEVGKDFVDFIFHILAMPLGTAIRLLGKQEMVGCLGKLYESVENLNDTYILQGKNKEIFLKPKAPNPFTSVPSALLTDKPTHKTYYMCGNCSYQYSFSDDPNTPCQNCSRPMTRALSYVAPPQKKDGPNEGFVKDAVTYMVMDDLVVKPLSTVSSVALLNEYNIKEFATLQEKNVQFGMNEAVKLLKASLHSSNVLTTVFLNDECDYQNPISGPEGKKFYILVDNQPWVKDLVSRPTHFWQLMVTKSRLPPFANSKVKKRMDTGELNELQAISQSNTSQLENFKKWFLLLDVATSSRKRALLPVKKAVRMWFFGCCSSCSCWS
ncbi:unnamed protein product [Fraxinus pennsylvanica]|uniref:Uncharacterized protein n=1 Tax=Fraxinus pennsylvanica TaxID=56036 RepID=A0AAD2AKW7_9LAMI|nr:unnamed protein product [Fraxinus pennsylvanica]